MQRKRVVVTDHAFRGLEHEAAAATAMGADFDVHACTTESGCVEAVTDADVVITNFAPITENVLRAMRPGGTVVRYGIGFDNVDVDAANRLGVWVANVPDYGVETVADHSAAFVLASCRKLSAYTHLIRENGWARPAELGTMPALSSLTVGFIGFGRIAQALHDRLRPFGFTFIASDPYPPNEQPPDVSFVNLAELASRANVVSLHAPATDDTLHMVNKQFLAALPPGAIVVNTARGPLVDTDALADALASGHIAAAALDVTDPEPLPLNSPLRSMPNVILTPHAAFYDEQSLDRLQRLVSEEVTRALRGEPLRCPVNRPTMRHM